MKERPILFSTPMVIATNEDLKNQTRRTKGLEEINKRPNDFRFIGQSQRSSLMWIFEDKISGHTVFARCPYGQVGDVLWVRETWQHTKCLNINPEDENYGYVYKASENGMDFANNIEGWTWKPSIFMPREACRIRLEITNIRVERLQDISEEDAISEGVIIEPDGLECWNYIKNKFDGSCPEESYQSLWKKINGKNSWDLNPWVWVIKFKRL